jgi:hypothetical protein
MTTTAPPARTASRCVRPGRFRPLGWDLARSEWIKLRTVRPTYWMLLLTAVGMGSGAVLTAAYVRHYSSVSAAARRVCSTRPPTA